jgi:hypothetical protein
MVVDGWLMRMNIRADVMIERSLTRKPPVRSSRHCGNMQIGAAFPEPDNALTVAP